MIFSINTKNCSNPAYNIQAEVEYFIARFNRKMLQKPRSLMKYQNNIFE